MTIIQNILLFFGFCPFCKKRLGRGVNTSACIAREHFIAKKYEKSN